MGFHINIYKCQSLGVDAYFYLKSSAVLLKTLRWLFKYIYFSVLGHIITSIEQQTVSLCSRRCGDINMILGGLLEDPE